MPGIGPTTPTNDLQRGTYVGGRQELQGETALLSQEGLVWAAQFDNKTTGFGHGWWEFPLEHFEVLGEGEIEVKDDWNDDIYEDDCYEESTD